MSHTPGPWSYHDASIEPQILGVNGETVVYELNTNEHDARLIAAAPELLEALEAALKAGIIDIDGEPERARAAIAKARGKP